MKVKNSGTRTTTRVGLLVPIADNTGAPFAAAAFERLEALLSDLAGGFTEFGRARGQYRSNGQTYNDEHRYYVATVPRHLARNVAQTVSAHIVNEFRQEAAFVELSDTQVAGF